MINKIDTISLTDLQDEQTGIIVTILGGKALTKRLADLGLSSGSEIKVIGRTLFSGPVQMRKRLI
jgi:Fe2+ transport system protein FeoA